MIACVYRILNGHVELLSHILILGMKLGKSHNWWQPTHACKCNACVYCSLHKNPLTKFIFPLTVVAMAPQIYGNVSYEFRDCHTHINLRLPYTHSALELSMVSFSSI